VICFKTNRVYDTSALSSFRIDSNVYGRQFTGVRQLYSAANFNTDVIRAVTPAPTFDQIETSSLFYSDFELITTFTNMEMTTSYLDIYEIEPRFHIPAGNDPATLWDAGLFPKVRKLMQLISFTKHLLNQDFFVFITKLKKLLK